MTPDSSEQFGQITGDTSGEAPMYIPAPNENQLSLRAVLTGCLVGLVVSAMNVRFGLTTGWTIGGSLIAAIGSVALFSVIAPMLSISRFSPLETNIAQTSASAAGTMTSAAGLVSAIPAMQLLGYEFSYMELVLWAGAVAWLGVFYAVPLRRQMVIHEKLRFPTGTATAATILAMYGTGGDAVRKGKYLLGFSLLAAAVVTLSHFIPAVGHPPLEQWIPLAVLGTAAAYGFSVLISPMMFGAGILIGPRIGASLALGAFVSWALIAPAVESAGWVSGPTMSYAEGSRGWILWTGVAIMVADALTSLAMSWRTILNTFKRSDSADGVEADPDEIPTSWWVGGLGVATLLTVTVSTLVFDIPWYLTVLAVALSSILAAIAVRSTGETDINPTGGMGKVTQLAFGALAPGRVDVNLMSAAVSSSGASQAGDMMQDLKTGWLLGAAPRKQLMAQLAGITVGIPVSAAVYSFYIQANPIGSEASPAPAAMAWKAMAELLAVGLDAMPTGAVYGVIAGLIFGMIIPLLRKATGWGWLPSGLAFGVAFIVPAYYSLAMFVGSIAYVIWKRVSPATATALAFSVASGLIAGDGVTGVILAVLNVAFGI